MSSFLGSDPEAVRRFAQLLRDRQEALERTRSILEPAAQCDPIWKGPDGDSFRIAVRTDVLPVLIDVTSRFSTLAGEADAHADEQDGASAASDPVGVQTHLPPPASPRPETPSRAGREGGRAHDRRGDGSEVGPPDGPLGSGLPDGLGDPVPGTTANDPGMTEWHPVDPGAGDWSSEDATIADHASHEAATLAATLMSSTWPDASDNLLHFLSNSGTDKQMDLDAYLEDESEIRTAIQSRERSIGLAAIERAKTSGIEGPVTFPVQTGWPGVEAASHNWYYATGSGNYSMHGQVTVYPPDANHPEWRFEMDTTLHYRDQYNWDGSKSTVIDLPGPFDPTVTDQQLAELHRAGLAKEFLLHGSTARRTTGP